MKGGLHWYVAVLRDIGVALAGFCKRAGIFLAKTIFVLTILLVVLALIIRWGNTAKITIVNRTGEPIVSGVLLVEEKRFAIGRIEPGAATTIAFQVGDEADYFGWVRTRSGRDLFAAAGYLGVYNLFHHERREITPTSRELPAEDAPSGSSE